MNRFRKIISWFVLASVLTGQCIGVAPAGAVECHSLAPSSDFKDEESLKKIREEAAAREFVLANSELLEWIRPYQDLTNLYGYKPWKELYEATGENAERVFQSGLPALKKAFGEELKQYWPGMVEIGKTSRKYAHQLFAFGLPALKIAFGEELKQYWPEIVRIGKAAEKNAWCLFLNGLPALRCLIKTKDDLTLFGNDLIDLSRAVGDCARIWFEAISDIKKAHGDAFDDDFWKLLKTRLINLCNVTTDYNREEIFDTIRERTTSF